MEHTRLCSIVELISDVGTELEIEISYELAQRILGYEELLIAVSDLCGELDCMFALALGANQHNLVRPHMTEENIIKVQNCRHLLQEMTVPSFVPNGAYLVGGTGVDSKPSRSNSIDQASSSDADGAESETVDPSMVLLTGPNYSGKSVYLKSVAQTIYLSHLGSFVPCSSAVIGLTDALLTRIRTGETVSRPHSAFMIDLQQIAQILQRASRRSLVVIDEFGKGTDTSNGAGLAAGLFQHLLSRGNEAPKVMAATHFHEIFELGYLAPQKGLAFAHMEVRVDRRTKTRIIDVEEGATGNEVTYLYNLRPGRSSESFGTQCAAMNGVPAAVVQRARLLSSLALKGEDLVSICAGVGKEEEEDLTYAESVARRFLEWDADGGQETEGDDPRALLEDWLGESGEGGGEMEETETETRDEGEDIHTDQG